MIPDPRWHIEDLGLTVVIIPLMEPGHDWLSPECWCEPQLEDGDEFTKPLLIHHRPQ